MGEQELSPCLTLLPTLLTARRLALFPGAEMMILYDIVTGERLGFGVLGSSLDDGRPGFGDASGTASVLMC